MNSVVTHAPVLWPLLRRPIRNVFEGIAPEWDKRDRDAAEYLAPLAAALLHVSPEPERALDVGTGTGAGALLVAREFPQARVRGLDLSEEMIRRAQRPRRPRPRGPGRVPRRRRLEAALGRRNPSTSSRSSTCRPFFAEIARVLRPGGHAVVAATRGSATPFYTPDSVLRRGFRRRGLEEVESGQRGCRDLLRG